MVNYHRDPLDRVFSALSDPTRRGIVAGLAAGPRAVGEIARPFRMSLPGILKHVRVLEDAGILSTAKEGRVVRCTLAAGALREAAAWMQKYERFWNERLDALGRYLDQQEDPPCPPPPAKPSRSRSAATTPRRRKKSGAR